MDRMGTVAALIAKRHSEIALYIPLSSDSTPGKAPGVSTKVMMGRRNFSACFMSRIAFL